MKLGVIGAGTMGGGIAQVAAQQGIDVRLLDVRTELVQAGVDRIRGFLQRAVERGRMSKADADATVGRIEPTVEFSALADVDAVIEAAVEDIAVKSQVFRQLDEHCPAHAILASNTSSLSVTEIGAATKRPEAVVGMHFFNPVPLMALVEVVRGYSTSDATMDRAVDLARLLGKTPVRASDTPGFIVNRIVRPFYNEALRILGDGVADYPIVDRIMKGVGFRMGPFELMDLIGNDVNFAVTHSIFSQLYGEPKLRPSFRQLRIVQSGNLGQKTGRGWYAYDGSSAPELPTIAAEPLMGPVAVVGDSALGMDLASALSAAGLETRVWSREPPRAATSGVHGVASIAEAVSGAALVVEAGWSRDTKREMLRDVARVAPRTPVASIALTVAASEAASWHANPSIVCGFAVLPPLADAKVVEVAPALQTDPAAVKAAESLAVAVGKEPVLVGDGSGGVAARIVALIVNEACAALMEGIATREDIDAAVRLGANYPHGPLEWADLIGVDLVYAIIRGMHEELREDRYRPAPLLRRMALAGWTGRDAGRGFSTF
ncbi:MAG TPA: 3-hydroxyacyl-CoA dehydrogenase NAD-binding domain-containing protein [Chloroflexota bacterium]|nr:3-hydroxyacyl-CoA dehydrogenase NAD-binding domain-containing protein [Chloroflexota bacterium]